MYGRGKSHVLPLVLPVTPPLPVPVYNTIVRHEAAAHYTVHYFKDFLFIFFVSFFNIFSVSSSVRILYISIVLSPLC